MVKRLPALAFSLALAFCITALALALPALGSPTAQAAEPGVALAPPLGTQPLPPYSVGGPNGYTFLTATTVYSEITGGTVLGTGAVDDNNYNNLPFGFTFYYNNIGLTTFSVNANGFIRMGGLGLSSCLYFPLADSDATCNNVVSALGRNLIGNAAGELRYELVGAAPNRVLVVQWKNFLSAGTTGDNYNFQIRFYEATNIIEFVYGSFTQNATDRTVQVGLRGPSNADFINLRTPGLTFGDWSAPQLGTLNVDMMGLTSSLFPSSGLVYRFLPPPPAPYYATSTKVVTPTGAVLTGRRLTYTIFLTNTGTTTGTPLLTDLIPAGTTFVPGSDSYSAFGFVPISYVTPLASDPVDPPQGNANLDLRDLYIVQDQNDFYIRFTIGADISAPNDWGKYLLFIDTDNVAGSGGNATGLGDDAWGRNIRVLNPHRPEYTIRTWVDTPFYNSGNTEVWKWNGASWANIGPVGSATLITGTTSAIEWKVSKSMLGWPSRLWVEVANTSGTATDNAQDTINQPANDWNATDWATLATLANSTFFNNAIVWQNALAPGQGMTVSFAVTVNANSGNIVNSAVITDALIEAPVVRSVTNTVIVPAYAGSTKTFTPTHDHPGQVVTWVVGISNSTAALGMPTLVDTIPAGLAYVPSSATTTSGPAPVFTGSAITWTGNIAAFGRVTVTFQTTITALSGILANTAVISDPLIATPVSSFISLTVQPPTGGPDAFGYTYKDSFAVGGPTFSWVLTTPAASRLNYGGSTNNGSVPVTLTFPFQFYSNVYTQAFVSTNGLVNFGAANTSAANQAIPTAGGNADNYLSCYWDDLRIHSTNPLTEGVYFETFGTAPNRSAVFWFYLEDAGAAGGPYNPMRFQTVLYENGTILCQYLENNLAQFPAGDGRSATIGLENGNGTIGRLYAFNKTPGPVDPNLAIVFNPPAYPVYALTKTAQTPAPTGALYNQPVTYTLRLTNTGFVTGTGVLTDLIPAGTTYIPGSATLQGPGTLDDAGLITWNGALVPLQTLTITFRVTNTTLSGRITNTVVFSDAMISASISATVGSNVLLPDLNSSQKTVSSALVPPGSLLVYTLTARNTSAFAPATLASISDVLPAGVSYVPGSATLQGTGILTDVGGIFWTGAITPNDRITITFQVTVTAMDGVITNTAVFSDGQLATPVTRMAATTVMAPRFNTSVKWASSSAVALGEIFTYTLRITNSGLVTSTGTTLVDMLPAGLRAYTTGVTATFGVVTATPTSVTWGGGLRPGESFTLTIPVSATAAACCQTLTNTAVISDPLISAPAVVIAPPVVVYGPYPSFSEAFESGGTLPLGWASQMVAFGFSTPKWEQATSGTNPTASPYSGTAMVVFNSFIASGGSAARLESPAIQLQANGRSALLFWMYHDAGAPGNVDWVQVQVSSTLTGGFVDIGPAIWRFESVSGWRRHAVDLSAYDGQPVQIGLVGTSANGGNIYVDELSVQKCCETLGGVSFSFSPLAPVINQSISFTATTLTGSTPINYVWSFGDGSMGMGSTMTHAYTNVGAYTVMLTATNACSQQVFTATVNVSTPAIPPDIEVTSSSPTALGNTTFFTGTLNAGSMPITYTWNFGDGNVLNAGLNVTHTYAVGLYNVTLTATNAGGVDVATTLVDVGLAPEASFASNTPAIAPNNTIVFTNTSLFGVSYLWNFGDGVTSTLTNPVHVYANALPTNTYTVTLTVVNPYGVDVFSDAVTLYNPARIVVAPTGLAQAQPVNITTTAALTFTNPGAGTLNWTVLENAGGGCFINAISWLTTTPVTGSTLGGQSSSVNVNFNSTGLNAGATYTGTVCVVSNGFDTPVISIPVTLTVQPTFGVTLAPFTSTQASFVGQTITHTLWVTNTGNFTDTFNLSLTGGTWPTTGPTVVGPVAPGAGLMVPITVSVPLTATHGQINTSTVTATSQANGSVSASSVLTTTAWLHRRYLPFVTK